MFSEPIGSKRSNTYILIHTRCFVIVGNPASLRDPSATNRARSQFQTFDQTQRPSRRPEMEKRRIELDRKFENREETVVQRECCTFQKSQRINLLNQINWSNLIFQNFTNSMA